MDYKDITVYVNNTPITIRFWEVAGHIVEGGIDTSSFEGEYIIDYDKDTEGDCFGDTIEDVILMATHEARKVIEAEREKTRKPSEIKALSEELKRQKGISELWYGKVKDLEASLAQTRKALCDRDRRIGTSTTTD